MKEFLEGLKESWGLMPTKVRIAFMFMLPAIISLILLIFWMAVRLIMYVAKLPMLTILIIAIIISFLVGLVIIWTETV